MTDHPSPDQQQPRSPAEAPAARPASIRSAAPSPHPPQLPDESTVRPAHSDAPFQPLFTLIADSTSRTSAPQTHHPNVHYIFSDDDPDTLLQALAAHREALAAAESPSASQQGGGPAPQRAILLDLVPTAGADDTGRPGGSGSAGYEVAWASSLSADWAVTGARVMRMGDNGGDDADDGGGAAVEVGGAMGPLMLRIEGVGIESAGGGGPAFPVAVPGAKTPSPEAEMHSSSGSGNRASGEEYGVLIDEFEKRMGVLRKVVGTSEERERALAAAGAVEGGGEETEEVNEGEDDETQRPREVGPPVGEEEDRGERQEEEDE